MNCITVRAAGTASSVDLTAGVRLGRPDQPNKGGVVVGDVRLRPHHLLCMQGFRGQGYAPQFIANLARLIDRLSKDGKMRVRIVAGADDVCLACPHLSKGGCSCSDLDVNDLDRKVQDRLGLSEGDSLDWFSLLKLIRQNVTVDHIGEFCSGCRWTDFDYCAKGIEDLGAARLNGTNPPAE